MTAVFVQLIADWTVSVKLDSTSLEIQLQCQTIPHETPQEMFQLWGRDNFHNLRQTEFAQSVVGLPELHCPSLQLYFYETGVAGDIRLPRKYRSWNRWIARSGGSC